MLGRRLGAARRGGNLGSMFESRVGVRLGGVGPVSLAACGARKWPGGRGA